MKPLQMTITNAHVPTFWQRCARLCSRNCHSRSMPFVRAFAKQCRLDDRCALPNTLQVCMLMLKSLPATNSWSQHILHVVTGKHLRSSFQKKPRLWQPICIAVGIACVHQQVLCCVVALCASVSPFWWVVQIQRLAQRRGSVPHVHTDQHPVHMIHNWK